MAALCSTSCGVCNSLFDNLISNGTTRAAMPRPPAPAPPRAERHVCLRLTSAGSGVLACRVGVLRVVFASYGTPAGQDASPPRPAPRRKPSVCLTPLPRLTHGVSVETNTAGRQPCSSRCILLSSMSSGHASPPHLPHPRPSLRYLPDLPSVPLPPCPWTLLSGRCGSFSQGVCHSTGSLLRAQQLCDGRSSCRLRAHAFGGVGRPPVACAGRRRRLFVSATCVGTRRNGLEQAGRAPSMHRSCAAHHRHLWLKVPCHKRLACLIVHPKEAMSAPQRATDHNAVDVPSMCAWGCLCVRRAIFSKCIVCCSSACTGIWQSASGAPNVCLSECTGPVSVGCLNATALRAVGPVAHERGTTR